ncbi:hypothetical protein PDG61_14930 [Mycolicibacterium sp. BiH015]|uniref:hypothetical protein n=1 Tax=Mycolicibacterium sp. BiH015 TaxID=3018808 RepID=UPI0022E2B953|nr:hypothetical protein [Mycolicibacterium sp. BiH015]MDA2892216.1 hypothetical protein [Mycolicibacterium sp. BiH015]
MTSPHGQQPSYRPGFAPYTFPEPAPRPSPSGVTVIIAAVLAGLGALTCLSEALLGILDLAGLSAPEGDSHVQTSVGIAGALLPVLILGILIDVVAGALLVAGTVVLARRRLTGRKLVVAGSAITIGGSLLSLGYVTAATTPYGLALLGLLFPLATLVLVLLPPTTAWLKARPSTEWSAR